MSFVRVRPFIGNESTTKSEQSFVPRPALDYEPPPNSTGKITALSILDPQLKYRPKKNGNFRVDRVFWSFVDPEPPSSLRGSPEPVRMPIEVLAPRQCDVFTHAAGSMIGSVADGLNAAFVVCGANESGRYYTLFGADEGANGNTVAFEESQRGVVPRFAEQLFALMKDKESETTSMECDLECVEIVDETYVDMLVTRKVRGRGPGGHRDVVVSGSFTPNSPSQEEMKVREDDKEGVRLQGCTKAALKDYASFLSALHYALRWRTRSSVGHNHLVVNFRIRSIVRLTDPANPANVATRTQRCTATFALVSSINLPVFRRCVDTAAQRDCNLDTLHHVVIPTRESALARLLSDVFSGNCNATFLSCVSPFFEHVKDTMATMELAAQAQKLRCSPKINEDSNTAQFRKLDDEVKGLKSEVRKTNEAMEVVQAELDKRDDALRQRRRLHEDNVHALAEAQENLRLEEITVEVQRMRYRRTVKAAEAEERHVAEELLAVEEQLRAEQAKLEKAQKEGKDVQASILRLRVRQDEEENASAIIQKRTAEIEELEKLVEHCERVVSGKEEPLRQDKATVEAALLVALAQHEESISAQATSETELARLNNEYEQTKSFLEAQREREKELLKLQTRLEEQRAKEAALNKECQDLEREIAEIEKRKEEEKKAASGCCAVQ